MLDDQLVQMFQRAERPDGDVPVLLGSAYPCQDAVGTGIGADRPVDVAAGRCCLFQIRFRLHAGQQQCGSDGASEKDDVMRIAGLIVP